MCPWSLQKPFFSFIGRVFLSKQVIQKRWFNFVICGRIYHDSLRFWSFNFTNVNNELSMSYHLTCHIGCIYYSATGPFHFRRLAVVVTCNSCNIHTDIRAQRDVAVSSCWGSVYLNVLSSVSWSSRFVSSLNGEVWAQVARVQIAF